MEQGFAIKNNFVQDVGLLKRLYSKLELLEIEGKFQINRSVLPLEQRPRLDKVLGYNFTEIEKIDELKDLHAVTKLLHFSPFELNA